MRTHTQQLNIKAWLLGLFFASAILSGKDVFATNSITVQGVMRDSSGDLVEEYTPTGGIKAVFYHATHCAAIVNGDADLLGCAPTGAAGSEVIDPFQIKAGAFSLSIVPTAGTVADMASAPTEWYVKIRGIFASGAPIGEFLIPLDSVPFSKTSEVAATVSATASGGNSIISAINATASGDTKINADRIPDLDGGSITSGTIGGSTSVNTTGTIDSGAITSTGTVSGATLLSSSLGTAASPAFRFSSDSNTGIYSSAADTLNFATGGVSRMSIDSSGNLATGALTSSGTVTSTGLFSSSLGTAADPIFSFSGDPNTGIFSSGADTLDFSTGGASRITIDSAGKVGIGTTAPASVLSGPVASTFAIGASLPTQAVGAVAGNALTLTAANATAGSSTVGAAAGGSVSITAGNAALLTSGSANGGSINITAGTGAGSLGVGHGGAVAILGGSGNPSNGFGGAVSLTGGTATGGSTGGAASLVGGTGPAGGQVYVTGGPGSNGHINITSGTGTSSNGRSGNILITVPDVTVNTANPGSITIKAGRGNYNTNTNAYGSGGSISLITQAGANSNNGALPTNTGGSITTTLGAGGNNTGGGTAGTAGSWIVAGAAGGTGTGGGSVGGVGTSMTLTSGVGGAGVAVGGNSGSIVLSIGAAGSGAVSGSQGSIQLAPTGGNVGIGTSTPGASSILDISSTSKGVVLPRMSKAQRDAITTPAAGMAVYQTDNTPGLRVYNGTNWMRFTETAD